MNPTLTSKAANDAGDGTGLLDKRIDGRVRGSSRHASGDVADEALRLLMVQTSGREGGVLTHGA